MGSVKLDPKVKLIANEYEKVIKMTEKTTEFHLKEDSSVVSLIEEAGAAAKSKLEITVISVGGNLTLKGNKVTIQSDDLLSFTGQASGILVDGDTLHFKAPLVNQKK